MERTETGDSGFAVWSSYMHTPLPPRAYLDNYLPQVLVHRHTLWTCCHWGTAPGRAYGSHSGGSAGGRWRKDDDNMWRLRGWWACGGVEKYQEGLASIGQARVRSPNYARSPTAIRSCHMRECNQLVKNGRPPQSTTDGAWASCASFSMQLRLGQKPIFVYSCVCLI